MDYTEWETRVAAYAVIIDETGRILLTWFNGESPLWTLPGGGVEYEESLEEAVVREVEEETGYVVEVGRPLFTSTSISPHSRLSGRPYKAVRVAFAATVVGGVLGTVEVDGTTDRAEWFALDAVGSPRAGVVDLAVASLQQLGHRDPR